MVRSASFCQFCLAVYLLSGLPDGSAPCSLAGLGLRKPQHMALFYWSIMFIALRLVSSSSLTLQPGGSTARRLRENVPVYRSLQDTNI